jgi:DNA-binding transcriptional ArsR family regulator
MTATPPLDPTLAKRLELLRGEDAACCALDLQGAATELRAAPGFTDALRRAKALSDESRLLVAALLRERGELCGCELQAALGLTHATVSHHMATLQDAGLVVGERRGKWVHYRLATGAERYLP